MTLGMAMALFWFAAFCVALIVWLRLRIQVRALQLELKLTRTYYEGSDAGRRRDNWPQLSL